MIDLIGISKRYGDIPAVAPLDLAIETGTTVLLGPSGCGKSTLLRLMIGVIRPDGGVVRFRGDPLTPRNIHRIRRQMGYVIQDGGLFPHLTGSGNLALLPRHLGWSRDRLDRRIHELAELTHLSTALLGQLPHRLSGGQRQRVSLMRALMLDPDVLLLDEPLGALDPMIRRELQQDLRDIIRRLKKTVVLVTHDIGEAAFFGDRVVLLREGRVVQQGKWPELVDAPGDSFVTKFINAQRLPPAATQETGT